MLAPNKLYARSFRIIAFQLIFSRVIKLRRLSWADILCVENTINP
jgi:hypothetical protein